MNKVRSVFNMLQMAAEAHARWEIETSTNILRNRKKLLILLALCLPIVAFLGISWAAGDLLGGKKAYAPAFYSTSIFLLTIFIGLVAGLITGCIGAGGGFIITPALMSIGVKGILAVGTDLFHIFAKAIMGTAVHRKLGNVSVKLAITFLVGSTLGVVVGGTINRAIYEFNPVMSDLFISLVYVFLLGFLGTYAMTDFLKLRRAGRAHRTLAPDEKKVATPPAAATTGLAQKLQSVRIPPMISFDEDLVPGGNRISGLFVAGCGFIVGLVAAIMGVGGGFLTFPMFVYLLGVSSFTTVGTDILQIIFTAGFAAISQYAIYGFIFYTLAMGMLLGSLIGIQVGALTTKVVKGIYIRGFYATAILAGFLNRLFALPKRLNQMEYISISKGLAGGLDLIGLIVFFVIIGIFGLWVLSMFFKNLNVLRGKEPSLTTVVEGVH
ncbi:MAG: sulfite exporter TauE/SafE family protein [Deltaproteobacteria bacterium]|nr:sulfite exporter TauE/SafE family protein [Deltaproteobacteria bacterium]MBW1951770.1 sulfite exporter TauE/SafE family protein [Deltaproteobacteria bacterium]MBW1986834.1 sulfite exporter TauE/SafE family protein [Deltaproteobacteria bacterium]MBW2134957.1 sulfite exporter TauE/SafE family protein [Deltaproteobacteria bacterium]